MGTVPAGQGALDVKLLDAAAPSLLREFDPNHGGFGSAPKFPHPMDLRVLLRHHARTRDPRALAAVRGAYTVADREVNITASLGIASTEAFGYELDTLMRRADMAVYAAKRAGRNRVVVATANDETAPEKDIPVTQKIRIAT